MSNAKRSLVLEILALLVFALTIADSALWAQHERDASSPMAQRRLQSEITNQEHGSEVPAPVVLALTWSHVARIAQQERDDSVQAVQEQQTRNKREFTSTDVATFSAEIVKSGRKLVLQDSIGEATYEIDDQTKAKAFAGKKVKITGTVDVTTYTAHISKIEPEL